MIAYCVLTGCIVHFAAVVLAAVPAVVHRHNVDHYCVPDQSQGECFTCCAYTKYYSETCALEHGAI
jgi:hypothetical protein